VRVSKYSDWIPVIFSQGEARLLHKEHACLLLIDVQEKLTLHVMHKETLIANCG
jgi:hypothetical protein